MASVQASRTLALIACISSLLAFIFECSIVPAAHLLPEKAGFYSFSWAIALTLIFASVGTILGDLSYRQSQNTYALLGMLGVLLVLVLFIIGIFVLMRPQ